MRVEEAARVWEYCASSPITCPKHPFHLNVHSFIILFYYELVNVGGFRVLANYQIIRRASWELQLTASHSEANSLGLATGIWSTAPMGLSPYLMGWEANSIVECVRTELNCRTSSWCCGELGGGKIITTHVVIRSVRSIMCVSKGKHRNVFPDSSQYFSCPLNLLLHSHVLCQSTQFSLPRHYLKNTYFTKTLPRTLHF